jgi:hypothetical protein
MKTNVFTLQLALLASLVIASSSCDRGPQVPQTTQSTAPDKPGGQPVYEGNFEKADCQAVVGWIRDTSAPDSAVSLDFYDCNTLLGNTTADIFRQDLKDAGKGNGKHGFTFSLPATVKDGAPHSISAKISGTEAPLYGSPRMITCPSQEASPQP